MVFMWRWLLTTTLVASFSTKLVAQEAVSAPKKTPPKTVRSCGALVSAESTEVFDYGSCVESEEPKGDEKNHFRSAEFVNSEDCLGELPLDMALGEALEKCAVFIPKHPAGFEN